MVYDPQKELLGEFADHGYYIEEYEDARVVCYKGKEIGAYSKAAPPSKLQGCCCRYENKLRETEMVGVSK